MSQEMFEKHSTQDIFLKGKIVQIDVTKIQYCVSMTEAELLSILDKDDKNIAGRNTLCHLVNAVDGVSGCEYDVSFGPHVWFDVDMGQEVDVKQTKRSVFAIISNYA